MILEDLKFALRNLALGMALALVLVPLTVLVAPHSSDLGTAAAAAVTPALVCYLLIRLIGEMIPAGALDRPAESGNQQVPQVRTVAVIAFAVLLLSLLLAAAAILSLPVYLLLSIGWAWKVSALLLILCVVTAPFSLIVTLVSTLRSFRPGLLEAALRARTIGAFRTWLRNFTPHHSAG